MSDGPRSPSCASDDVATLMRGFSVFVLPSLVILIALSWLYMVYGSVPAVAGILVFAWVELAYTNRVDPSTLSILPVLRPPVHAFRLRTHRLKSPAHARTHSVPLGRGPREARADLRP